MKWMLDQIEHDEKTLRELSQSAEPPGSGAMLREIAKDLRWMRDRLLKWRRTIVEADSELSAIGHGRPEDRIACRKISGDLRQIYEGTKAKVPPVGECTVTVTADTAVLRRSLKAIADVWQEWRGVVKSCRFCGASADKGDAIIHRGDCIVPMAVTVTSAQDWM